MKGVFCMRKLLTLLICGILARNTYANLTTVVELDRDADVVTCEDYNGNLWEFYGCEDWEIGDHCNLVMFDCGTAEVADDVIVRATYERMD